MKKILGFRILSPVLLYFFLVATPAIASYPQVDAGGFHTCAVKPDKTLMCWGFGDLGQTTPPAGSFTMVSAGQYHSCAVKNDSSISCWGDNANGQSSPSAGTYTAVSAGATHSCGLKTGGSAACWGSNGSGESAVQSSVFTAVGAGSFYSCGLKGDKTISCWGNITTPPSGSYSSLSVGKSHSCAVGIDSSISCWGDNSYGKATPSEGTYTSVSAGDNSSCGIKSDGAVVCWGYNNNGRGVPPEGQFTSVTAGGDHVCGVRNDSTVSCWGNNNYGQAPPLTITPSVLGQGFAGFPYSNTLTGNGGIAPYTFKLLSGTLPPGISFSSNGTVSGTPATAGTYTFSIQTTDSNSLPFSGTNPYTVTIGTYPQVSAGLQHNCAVKSNGSVMCWGDDSNGQATPPAGTFTAVSSGGFLGFFGPNGAHTCGLKVDGTVACWGNNSNGQATPPTGSFTSISAGGSHTCGIKVNGTIACWGSNSFSESTPPSGAFTAVSAGNGFSCGIKPDKTVVCWGSGGNGETSPPAGTFSTISAGSMVSCGIATDGSVSCWGSIATAPSGTFTSVSSGFGTACGVKSDSSVTCWGDNSAGQQNTPGGSFSTVSAGGLHACGLRTDGSLTCWGDNSKKQAQPITTLPATLPGATLGMAYSQTLTGAGNTAPYSFKKISGTLPPGLSLSSGGALSGTPSSAGNYSFTVETSDSSSIPFSGTTNYAITVSYTVTGSISSGSGELPTCDSPVSSGSQSICILNPAEGWYVASLTDNGVDAMLQVNNNQYAIASVTKNHSIAVTYQEYFVRRISGAATHYHLNIQNAFDNAVNNDKIKILDLLYPGNLVFNRPSQTVELEGGYTSGFISNPGDSILNGKLEIRNGKLVLKMIGVR